MSSELVGPDFHFRYKIIDIRTGTGRQEGKEEGRQEEGLAILRRLIGKRFGVLPAWAEQRLATLSTEQIEDLSLSVLDAKSIGELFDR